MEQEQKQDNVKLPELEGEIEAYLFASDTPISPSRLQSMTGVTSVKDVKGAVKSLEDFYREHSRSFGIVEVAGGYQLVTLPEYADRVARLFKSRRKARLSRPALETLAIIAYKQPINRLAIEAIRGVNCDGVLTTLIDRELVTISGRGEGVGKPYLYSTTTRFLEYLGLKDYRELPDMAELEKNLMDLELIPRPRDEAGDAYVHSATDHDISPDSKNSDAQAEDAGSLDNSGDDPDKEAEPVIEGEDSGQVVDESDKSEDISTDMEADEEDGKNAVQ
ncbi:MAG: SMC-Scp complex subunit ScpB [Candidatus Krumholzibacteria bacterium]|nr:SMC-Scp complex subunit ScpB [Candidatus Krumholzibacteria bacterium]